MKLRQKDSEIAYKELDYHDGFSKFCRWRGLKKRHVGRSPVVRFDTFDNYPFVRDAHFRRTRKTRKITIALRCFRDETDRNRNLENNGKGQVIGRGPVAGWLLREEMKKKSSFDETPARVQDTRASFFSDLSS